MCSGQMQFDCDNYLVSLYLKLLNHINDRHPPRSGCSTQILVVHKSILHYSPETTLFFAYLHKYIGQCELQLVMENEIKHIRVSICPPQFNEKQCHYYDIVSLILQIDIIFCTQETLQKWLYVITQQEHYLQTIKQQHKIKHFFLYFIKMNFHGKKLAHNLKLFDS